MKWQNKFWAIAAIPFLCVSFSFYSCGKNGEAKDKNGAEEEAVLIPVEVTVVSQDEISAFLSGTATIETEEEAEVVAKTSGIVERILVEEGMPVRKGQILAQLEDDMLAIELEKAVADLDKLENDYHRNKELFSKKLISKEEFQNKRFEYDAQKATYKRAKLNLEYASIRAPFSGVVATRYIKNGNMISVNQPAFKVVDFEHLIANLFVPEGEAHKIEIGQRAQLNFDATNATTFAGRVARISPIVDPASGTMKVTVAVNSAGSNIKPGMFVRIRIVYDTHPKSMLIPKQAVLAEDEEESVFIVQDSVAIRKHVKTGFTSETMVEILSGLSLGEQVVVVGQNGLKDSSKVEIVQ